MVRTNFTVVVDGTAPFTFQWTDNGADIAGETGPTYTMAHIPYTENNHQIRVRVTNPANVDGVTSAAALLTVIRDTTPPTVVKANANSGGDAVTVVFSEAVSDTALDLANYSIDQGVVISYTTRSSDTTVVLHLTTPLPGGLSYILSIHGVQDTASSRRTRWPRPRSRSGLPCSKSAPFSTRSMPILGDGQGSLASSAEPIPGIRITPTGRTL